jgi:hypothetical protein
MTQVAYITTGKTSFKRLSSQVAVHASAFPFIGYTTTKPTTGLVQNAVGTAVPSSADSILRLSPFQMDVVKNSTVRMRVVGWNPYTDTGSTVLWIPSIQADVTLAYAATTAQPPITVNSELMYPISSIATFASAPSASTVGYYSPVAAVGTETSPAQISLYLRGNVMTQLQFICPSQAATGNLVNATYSITTFGTTVNWVAMGAVAAASGTGSTTGSSTTLNVTAATGTFVAGQLIMGTGITAGTTISTATLVSAGVWTIVLSAAMTVTAAAVTTVALTQTFKSTATAGVGTGTITSTFGAFYGTI